MRKLPAAHGFLVGPFYVRRALRILPLFYAAICVATVATSERAADLVHAIPYLTFVFFWPGSAVSMLPFSGAWWSLAVEVQFYAALPWVAPLCGRSRTTTLVLLGGFAVCWTATTLCWRAWGLNSALLSWSVLGRAPLFLCGIGAAWVYHRHGDALRARLGRERWLRHGGADLLLLGAFASLAALQRWRLASFEWVQSFELPLLVPEGVLWATVILCVLLLPLAAKPLLSNRFLRWLGVLSYSIYLIHFPLLRLGLQTVRRLFPGMVGTAWDGASVAWIVVSTVACLALSTLTYRFIEQPFLVRKTTLGVAKGGRADRPG